jgi:hypothetical protein
MSAAHVNVIDYSRRTDGVANKAQLDYFLTALGREWIGYPHPRYVFCSPEAKEKLVAKGIKLWCRYALERGSVISWWSKDFANLIAAWSTSPENERLLARYKHHFCFAICGPEHSLLEPGLGATLAERYEQIRWLVNKCRAIGQDPDTSILIKVDPIHVLAGAADGSVHLEFIPDLCAVMNSVGLTRIHISFIQYNFAGVGKRLEGRAARTDEGDQRLIVRIYLEPFTGPAGIRLQSCSTAVVPQGACVGWRDITGHDAPAGFVGERKGCTCYPHKRDVGDKSVGCVHGCKYCYSNPAHYDW